MVAISSKIGGKLWDLVEKSEPGEDIHVTFSYDENKYDLAYRQVFVYLFHVVVLPIALLAAIKINTVGPVCKFTTKNLVALLELPATFSLIYNIVTGPMFFGAETSGLGYL
jgi:hypothetical protein